MSTVLSDPVSIALMTSELSNKMAAIAGSLTVSPLQESLNRNEQKPG